MSDKLVMCDKKTNSISHAYFKWVPGMYGLSLLYNRYIVPWQMDLLWSTCSMLLSHRSCHWFLHFLYKDRLSWCMYYCWKSRSGMGSLIILIGGDVFNHQYLKWNCRFRSCGVKTTFFSRKDDKRWMKERMK